MCGLADADSTECNEDTPHKVIYKLRDLLGVDDLGGTMRLGQYACDLAPDSLAHRLYGTDVDQRAAPPPLRVQPRYEKMLTANGLAIFGRSPDGKFVEIAELPDHPWFIAVQFHPEFKSKPLQPHPLFASFVEASHRHSNAGSRRTATADRRRSAQRYSGRSPR